MHDESVAPFCHTATSSQEAYLQTCFTAGVAGISLVLLLTAAGAALNVDRLAVQNDGWELDSVEDPNSVSAAAALRGFVVRKVATKEVHVASGIETIRE